MVDNTPIGQGEPAAGRWRAGGRSASSRVVIVLAMAMLAIAALPLVMLALSRLPAERAYQRCAEQADVSHCHDPLTSWFP